MRADHRARPGSGHDAAVCARRSASSSIRRRGSRVWAQRIRRLLRRDRGPAGGSARRLRHRHAGWRGSHLPGDADRQNLGAGGRGGRHSGWPARTASYALIAVVGGAALTGVISRIAGPLRWASAAVLILLAVPDCLDGDSRPPCRRARARLPDPSMTGRPRLRVAARHHPVEPGDGAVLQRARARQPGHRPRRRGGVGGLRASAAFVASASWQLVLSPAGWRSGGC